MTNKRLDDLERAAAAVGGDAESEGEREGIIEDFANASPEHAALVDAILAEHGAESWSTILKADAPESAELRNVLGRWLASKDVRWPGAQIMRAARIPGIFDSTLAAGASGVIQIICFDTQTAG